MLTLLYVIEKALSLLNETECTVSIVLLPECRHVSNSASLSLALLKIILFC